MASDGTVTIRCASPEDAPAIGELVHGLLCEIDTPRYSASQYAETVRNLLTDGGSFHVMLAFPPDNETGPPVGVITISESAALYSGGCYAEIQEFFVVPGQRGTGVGAGLLGAAKTLAEQRGWERLQLHVSDLRDGGRSLEFYRRKGFEPIGTTMRYRLMASAG